MHQQVSQQFTAIQDSLGTFLSDYLLYTGYSINHASKVLGYGRDVIYRIVSKKYQATRLLTVCELSDILNVEVFDLLQYQKERDFDRLIKNNDAIK